MRVHPLAIPAPLYVQYFRVGIFYYFFFCFLLLLLPFEYNTYIYIYSFLTRIMTDNNKERGRSHARNAFLIIAGFVPILFYVPVQPIAYNIIIYEQ